MAMFEFKQKGDFKNLEKYVKKLAKRGYLYDGILERYAQEGVNALSVATPKDTGKTAASWGYEIERGDGYAKIIWTNSNLADGWCPIALLIQYGHGTGTGGYVQGRDYINPAVRPTFDKMANAVWKEVTSV